MNAQQLQESFTLSLIEAQEKELLVGTTGFII